ncbi:hypothetical protein LJK88_14640 [Paenibacillus sp. P26]|nr:hypothetical protein LJK88_14640 [Paenibacillus sp. P26]
METVRRKIKFEYYRVVSRKREDEIRTPDRLFDLRRWIDKANKKSLEARTFDYRQERSRLEEAGFDEDVNQWYLHFSRLRDSLLPSKATVTSKVEPFTLEEDEFLGEEVTALYDEDSFILMVQRNRLSLGHSGLEEYLNLIWAEDEETIYLRPILATDIVERAKKGDQVRKITIRFADLETREMKEGSKSSIRRLVEGMRNYGAVNGEITLSVGHSRDKTLAAETINDSIDDILLNKGFITKAEVSIKNEGDEVEIMDLFEEASVKL